ncbi:MAG: NADPH-dependent 7-cyano-7-deazaguanine reductase QueF [Candidatus Omnitrophica bacterium]|nr:NADPH-dependent 7-cyano-7-deazaguanine reductase QueF [Candidatus Omnitrophota bacterium]
MIYSNREIDPLEKKAKKTTGKLYDPCDIDQGILQTIAYKYPKRKITVELNSNEFTCVCPFSGLPDFANLTIRYTPREKLIETKSLKYYLYAFRNVRIYNEHVVNKILEDLVKVLKPHNFEVVAHFTTRGGVESKVTANYKNSQERNA